VLERRLQQLFSHTCRGRLHLDCLRRRVRADRFAVHRFGAVMPRRVLRWRLQAALPRGGGGEPRHDGMLRSRLLQRGQRHVRVLGRLRRGQLLGSLPARTPASERHARHALWWRRPRLVRKPDGVRVQHWLLGPGVRVRVPWWCSEPVQRPRGVLHDRARATASVARQAPVSATRRPSGASFVGMRARAALRSTAALTATSFVRGVLGLLLATCASVPLALSAAIVV